MTATSTRADPILLELVKNALDAVVDEMAIAKMRSAYSTNLKTAMDMSCALCDADGRLVAQGLTLPLHLGSVPDAMAAVRARFAGEVHEGDVYLLNDPFGGGTHLPDFYVVKPIHLDGSLVGWSVSVAHHMDVGGMTPGGNGCDATEVYQEGLRIPVLRLHDRGAPVDAVLALLAANVRIPHMVLGDLRAQVSACLTGEREYLALVERHGWEVFSASTDALLVQAERLARSAISAMPDGRYAFVDWIDEDGIGTDPIPIAVTLTIGGDEMVVDFEGSAPQVQGAINSPLPFTKSAVYACVRHLIGGDPPNNEGYFRPITVVAPPASVVNPVLPASVAARGLTGFRIANAVFGALAQVAPDRVFACEVGGDTGVSYGGWTPDRQPFVFVEFLYGGWGGRPDRDGVDVCSSAVVNFSNNPVEIVEAEYPLMVEEYGYVPDSGGPGLHRGSLAVARRYRFDNPTATLQLRSDRRRFLPYGLQGGGSGTASSSELTTAAGTEQLPAKGRVTVHAGDVLRHVVAGAGGWGDPYERDPARVLADVLDEKLSATYARRHYGVVLDASCTAVDVEATDRRRAQERGRRADARPG